MIEISLLSQKSPYKIQQSIDFLEREREKEGERGGEREREKRKSKKKKRKEEIEQSLPYYYSHTRIQEYFFATLQRG